MSSSTTTTAPKTTHASPPILAHQTAAQTWAEGQAVSFLVPVNTFTDPAGEVLQYSATLSNGQALPSWLLFNPSTETFSGNAPLIAASLALTVTATNTSGLFSSETIQAHVVPMAPKMVGTIPTQAWTAGRAFSQMLPPNIFTDPQHQTLHYTAMLASGQALPTWLTFNATGNPTFSGTAPFALGDLTIKVTATDTSGLSTSGTFGAAVVAQAPAVTSFGSYQIWGLGKPISFNAGRTFTDPQGEALHFTATLSSGQALPTWLTFNNQTGTFGGTAPITPATLGIRVTATNASGLFTTEMIEANVLGAPPIVAHQTPNQTWTPGHGMTFLLPANTFTDPQGSKLTYTASEISGTDQTSWLHFNGTTGLFSGIVPNSADGVIGINVVATNTHFMSASETFGLALGGTSGTAIPPTFQATEFLMLHSAPI